MVELDKDCLHIIFGFLTPVEWIQISEVCQLWKNVVERQWQKCEKVDICDYKVCRTFGDKRIISFSAGNAEKFVRHVAKFCKRFFVFTMEKNDPAIMCGQTTYRMGGLTVDRLLRLLTANSTEVEGAEFMLDVKPEILKLLFKNNKIKDLKVFKCSYDFWLDIPTDGIENLWVQFENHSGTESFEGHFPNLQKLDLGFMTNYRVHEYQQIMQRTLPYVLGIKSLTLSIEAFKLPAITLEHVARLPHLEELSLQFHHRDLFAKSPEHPKFDQQFDPSTFTKLRVLKIKNFRVPDNTFKSMLLLPNLEKLEVDDSIQGFRTMNHLPEMSKLSYFAVKFEKSRIINVKNLFNAVKKMPNLEILCVKGITKMQYVTITQKGINLAKSQGKVVALERLDDEEDDNEKYVTMGEIGRETKDEQDTTPVLHLRFGIAE